MTKIKVEEVISHGEYLKKLIDEQGAENFFVEQIAYSNDKSFLKIVNFETKDNVTYTDNGEDLIIRGE